MSDKKCILTITHKPIKSSHKIAGEDREGQISIWQAPKDYAPPPREPDHFKQLVGHSVSDTTKIASNTLKTHGYESPEDIPIAELTQADGHTAKLSNLYCTERMFYRIEQLKKTLEKVDSADSIDPELLYEAVYNALEMKHAQMVARSYALEPQTIAGQGRRSPRGASEQTCREAVARYRELRQAEPDTPKTKIQARVAKEYGVERFSMSRWIKNHG